MIPLSNEEIKKLADFLNMSYVLLKLKLALSDNYKRRNR